MKNSAFRVPHSALESWLPDMDLNHDKVIQSHLCYRYTIGHSKAAGRLDGSLYQSSQQRRTGVSPVSNFIFPNKRQAGSLSY